jgi:hypothetical protein
LNTDQKLGAGSVLAVLGALGIVLFPLLGWTEIRSPWDFVLGFFFGVSAGLGVALSIWGMLERRSPG